LIDVTAGLMWTGDTFYEGPIWLFFPETDLAAYETSLARLAALAPQLKALLPAHMTHELAEDVIAHIRDALNIGLVLGK
jgi:glyoxylase-like metal-dependent hydrolase (beta-lactamase superfamily II)